MKILPRLGFEAVTSGPQGQLGRVQRLHSQFRSSVELGGSGKPVSSQGQLGKILKDN